MPIPEPGRAWWQVRYRDGRTVAEWDVPWTEVRRQGLVAARLLCPNGEIAEFGTHAHADLADRLFQLKVSVAVAGLGSRTEAHVLGLVTDTDGGCTLAVWEVAPRQLRVLRDQVPRLCYGRLGPLAGDLVGLRGLN